MLSYAKSGKFPQTILIEGGDSEKRANFARFLANIIVCESDSEKPCGECSACVKCASGNHPDIKEYGSEKPNSVFKVETSREIRQDAFVIPNDSDKKVYILKETQNMNDASENAMLKIFEEPPQFDYFIMTCSSRNAMLDTVLSRAAVINIGQSEQELSDEAVTIAEDTAEALLGDSEAMLVEKLAPLASKKDIFQEVSACLKRIFIDCIIYKRTNENNSDYADITQRLCSSLTVQKLYALANVVTGLEEQFRLNANYNLLITKMGISLRAAVGK